MIPDESLKDPRRRRRGFVSTVLLTAAALAIGGVHPAWASGPSAFCHTVDGAFTDCTVGPPIEEWSDIPSNVFLSGGSYVYGDQNPAHTMLFLMYDYPLLTAPLGLTECSSVTFDVEELGKIDTYTIEIGNCATGGFDVLVNSIKLPERLEEDIVAAGGFGPSPNSVTPHQMYEVGVPLVLVYSPDDPRFWTSGIPQPPLLPDGDQDGDGVLNAVDNCPVTVNPGQEDFDGIGSGDACTPCPGEDGDADGVPDVRDNCPSASNRDQRDKDGDLIGDRCDSCLKGADPMVDCAGRPALDRDKDTVGNSEDNCPFVSNIDQANADADDFGDVCDLCPNDATNSCSGPPSCKTCFPDSDADGHADNDDNCRTLANADQADADGDEVGDVCDNCPASALDDCPVKADNDADTVVNEDDNCPGVANLDQFDTDLDDIGNLCDPCGGDASNACVACTPLGPLPRSMGSDQATGHGAIVNAKSDGSTESEARSECPSPELCADDIPKDVYSYVNKKVSALIKCGKKGYDPCDTSSANAIKISLACKGVADCAIDAAIELLLGDNNPHPVELTDPCAKSIATEGGKFVRKMVFNHSKGKDNLTPAQETARRASVADKCQDPVGGGVSLGGNCQNQTTRAGVIDCVFDELHRAEPLP